MPIINVQILEGRPESDIKELISSLTSTTAECLSVSEDRVRVLIEEVPQSRWAVGGLTMSERNKINQNLEKETQNEDKNGNNI